MQMTSAIASLHQEKKDPPSKNRVGGFEVVTYSCTRVIWPQVPETHQETYTTTTTTVSGVVEWLSKDPIGISGGLNQYVAFGNNSVNFRDPFGDEPITITIGGVTVGAGTALGYAAAGAAVYWTTTPEGHRTIQGGLQATWEGMKTGADAARNAIDSLVNFAKGGGRRKGERGQAGSADGTGNPWKHRRPDPNNPNKMLEKDPHTGKWKPKPKPPNAPWAFVPPAFDWYRDHSSGAGGEYDKCQ